MKDCVENMEDYKQDVLKKDYMNKIMKINEVLSESNYVKVN